MCGITGFLDFDGKVSVKEFVNGNNIASYRGPDDEGYYLCTLEDDEGIHCYGKDTIQDIIADKKFQDIENYFMRRCYLGFGHRRLSIIDLSKNGHQPMTSADTNNYVITFNGEIYNYLELREELKGEGVELYTQSDTEIILKSYEKWGEDCVRRFNGMWSFVILDRKKQKLFCSRDRLGAKPFHYYFNNNTFVFSSEIKQILEYNQSDRYLNEEAFAYAVCYGISDYSRDTLIDDIFVLQGGKNMTIEFDFEKKKILSCTEYSYWDLSIREVNDCRSIEEYCSEIYSEIKRSIRYRLRSDASIAVLLSGGLDSSSLTVIANTLLREKEEKIHTFSLSYPHESINEYEYARIINDFCEADAKYCTPEVTNLIDEFKELVWHTEGMTYYSLIGAERIIREVAKNGYKVALNGQGGDETLLGYERYYAFYLKGILKTKGFRHFIKATHDIVNHSKLSATQLVSYYLYFNYPRIRMVKQKHSKKRYLSDRVLKRVTLSKTKELFEAKSLEALEYNEIRKTQLTHILRWDDRIYMKNSIESRVPFIDYKYMEKALQIPANRKIGGGYTKILLRRIMDPIMPKEVTWRKDKRGFESPVKKWVSCLSEDDLNWVFDDVRSDVFYNIDMIKELIKRKPQSTIVQEFLSIEVFMKLFDVRIR